MKNLFFLFSFLFIARITYSQEIYYRIKFPISQINIAAQAGIAVEETFFDGYGNLVAEVSSPELQQLKEWNINYEVLIENLTNFYVTRNENISYSPKIMQTGSVPVPQDFALGSMGGFCTLSELEYHLDNMASKYPHLVTDKLSIGTTHEGRDIYMVKISDNPGIEEAETKVLYTGMHHAREPIGMQQMLFFMYHILESYATDPYIHQLLDTTELYFIPCINPDGYEFNRQISPQGGGMWRKNRRPNPDFSYGVDLNRNYGFMWGYDDIGSSPNPWSETYRGPSAFSEPETQAIHDFIVQKSFPLVLNYHSYSNLLLYPWGYIPDTTPDHRIFSQFASKLTMDNAYNAGPASLMLYSVNGNSDDWMYADPEKPRIFAYTPEVGNPNDGFWPTIDRIIPLCQEQVSANLLAARFAGRYAEVKDLSPMVINQTNGYIRFNLKRFGLEDNVNYTIELQPISNNITFTSNPIVYSNPLLFKTYTDSIAYVLDPSVNGGDEIRFALKLYDGFFTHTDTLVKIYGYPQYIYQNDCNSLTGWTSNKWDISTFYYTSAPASITDSRFGNYSSNANAIIYSTDEIDLTDVKAAFLTFMARWETQLRYDFVQFLISENNGSTWQPMSGRYTRPSPNPWVDGQPVYDGQQTSWIKEEINLKKFLGKKIRVMFQLRSDELTNKDGFYFDDFKVGAFYEATGIVSSDRQNLFALHPNPAKGWLTIIWKSEYAEEITYTIYNSSGQKVVTGNIASGETQIDISRLKAGIYHIELTGKRFTPLSKALVVLP